MSSKLYVLPYKQKSMSAKAIAKGLGVQRILRQNSRWKNGPDKIVINWGCSSNRVPEHCKDAVFINQPRDVDKALNKIKTFQYLSQAWVNTPDWCTNKETAQALDGIVYCRTKLAGHGGKGIVVAKDPSEIVEAPLYTAYVEAKDEYRVHVAFGKAIDIRRKAKRNGVEGNPFIKNKKNGYVFKMNDIEKPQAVYDIALAACKALSLDFCSVDILWDGEVATVLEVNTASGLHGTTIKNYVGAFNEYINS